MATVKFCCKQEFARSKQNLQSFIWKLVSSCKRIYNHIMSRLTADYVLQIYSSICLGYIEYSCSAYKIDSASSTDSLRDYKSIRVVVALLLLPGYLGLPGFNWNSCTDFNFLSIYSSLFILFLFLATVPRGHTAICL